MKRGYTIVPNDFFDLGLPPYSLAFLIFIKKWEGAKNKPLSSSYIAKGIHIHRKTVESIKKELQALNIIEVRKDYIPHRITINYEGINNILKTSIESKKTHNKHKVNLPPLPKIHEDSGETSLHQPATAQFKTWEGMTDEDYESLADEMFGPIGR